MPITQTLVASTVMDRAAVLNNDAAKSIYTYVIQIPYLNMALQELQEYFELNNIPVTDAITSDAIAVAAGDTTLILPLDFIEPKLLWESESGQNTWITITRVDSLPRQIEDVELSQFGAYVWQSQKIQFLPTNRVNDVKMEYIRTLFDPVVASGDVLDVINAASFLEYRTGALLSEFCGENPSRAQSLNSDALIALDRALGIGTKGRQAINIRHRPFRSSYKRRNYG